MVIVFSRAPVPGRVKTRLVPRLGEWGAARLHARLTSHALRTARAAACGPVELHDTARQRGADLGERMHRALSHALRFVRERVQSLTVAPERPRPGHLYACTLSQAAYAGRPHTFIVGLEDHAGALDAFGAGSTDLLVGTQMIAKGLDFPNVALVGIVSADTSLSVPDFRAAEKTFQLLTQVAGRAGRGDDAGRRPPRQPGSAPSPERPLATSPTRSTFIRNRRQRAGRAFGRGNS